LLAPSSSEQPALGREALASRVPIAVAAPFLMWDAAVTGRHWWFSPEILFFIAAPFACLFIPL
jgi:hypothetical protein